ncbi:acylneuraminate cytidylyltransferase family protein, partial [Candidatus Pelagibacter sp.]|nr:acylneuraminate cytidylyltransferase family protein [Candidatus Pelagibacter sp.]
MNFLTIIPARGGSKSIKNKNIKNFDKKPLIYWTLKAAKKSKYVKDLIISTDSKKIAKVCETYGFPVSSLRPKNLSTS